MSKTLNKYITAIDYAEGALLVLYKQWCFSLLTYYSHQTPAGIASVIISLVFLISDRIVKIWKKKINTERLIYWLEAS